VPGLQTNRLVLGQLSVEDKSNEIVAVPKLLEMLELSGSVVTIDAMGCQKKIAKKVIEKKSDYVFCLKDNQQNLRKEVESFFSDEINSKYVSESETVDGDHGRIEVRRCTSASSNFLRESDKWEGLSSMCMLESSREINGETSTERRYFISSLESDSSRLAEIIRSHWGIENSLHWVLDVNFREDDCRIRDRASAANLAAIRRASVGLLNAEKSTKKSMRRKMNLAHMDFEYLIKVISGRGSKKAVS